jgi:glycosyltransferase involved in cell wall biosynthesis
MKILHIASSFNQSNLYIELFNNIHYLGDVTQEVFCPVRNTSTKVDFSKIDNNIKYKILKILNIKDRFCFFGKAKKVFKELNSQYNLSKYDLVHAHYLYTDGAIALKIYKEYKTKYIVTVRNTDINIFYKYRLLLRPLFYEIINNAEKIIFISPSYQNKFFDIVFKQTNFANIKNKCTVVTNGVNNYWIDNIYKKTKFLENKKVRFLFVGDINKNKNIINIVKSLLKFQYEFNWTLDIVGPDKGCLSKLNKLISSQKNIKYYGAIYSKEKLKEIFRNSDIFIMPSFKETFGLVYIEALSQGLPVIYSKYEAIDGLFKENFICESVIPDSLSSINKGINNLVERYDSIQVHTYNEAKIFNWNNIASKILKIYNEKI